MNPQQLFARLKSLAGALSAGQIASLALAFVVVVGIVAGSTFWLARPTYRVLFADMDPESASQVASRLKDQSIPYEIADGGRAVRVPEDRLDQLRLDFSAQGLPTTGRIGFEIFDRTQFGATEFLEQVNYRRALEGEIARTIATLQEVSSARVHIAMAKESIFAERQQPAKASVVLKLRQPNRPLSPQTVNGIASLVAASVEGLRPEAIVVMDSAGRPLARPAAGDDAPLGAVEIERQQRFERDMAARVVALLEPVVGEGHVRVNVAAHLNLDAQDQVEERWDTNPILRSRSVTTEGGPGAQLTQGIAGARANLPDAVPPGATQPQAPSVAPAATGLTTAGALRASETANYEVGKIVRHTTRPRGDVARLSVAVIVDDDHVAKKEQDGRITRTRKPRDPGDLQKLQALVSASVGLDAARGDLITIENISFEEEPEQEPPAASLMERVGPVLGQIGRVLAILLVGLLAFVYFVRPLMKRALTVSRYQEQLAAVPRELPRTIEEVEGEIEAQLDAAAAKVTDRKLPVLTKRVSSMAVKEPESAARLMRSWLIEDRK